MLRGRPPGGAQRPCAAPQRGRDGDPQRDQGAEKDGLHGVVCGKVITINGSFHCHGGYPNSWMVYKGKSHLEMDENWG